MSIALHRSSGRQFDLRRDNASVINRHRRLFECASSYVLVNHWLNQNLDLLCDMIAFDHGMRRQDSLNITKPAGKFAIPVDRRFKRRLELCPLLPAQFVQLGAIDCIAAVIELPIVRVLDPSFYVGQPEQAQELFRELHVRDLILRVDIVSLSNLAFVQDGVKGFRRVASI
jgi:hypothetical protein